MASTTPFSRNYTPLSEINKNRIDWSIRVRVCRKWKTTGNGRIPQTLEFVFVDKEGTRIQATVKHFLMSLFDDITNEGDLLSVRQFSVVDSQRSFPVTDNPHRIMLQRNTSVTPTTFPNFPKTLFQFKSFDDIKEKVQRADGPLFDIIGNVVDISDVKLKDNPASKGNKSIELMLQDLDGNKIECVLWEPYCYQMNRFIERVRRKEMDHNVIVIQLCRSKSYQRGVGISNTYHATKVITDPNLEEIVDFRNKLPDSEVDLSYDGSMISTSSYVSVKDELQNPETVVLSIKDLKTTDLTGKYWIVGSISEIMYDRGWCYTSCVKCRKKVTEKDSKLFCDGCDDYVSGNLSYKIHAQFVDGSDNVLLLIWNDVVKKLIGKAAAAISSKKNVEIIHIEDADGNQKEEKKIEVPQTVDDLIGKELMFKVTVETKHIEGTDTVYSVDRYSDDANFLKRHKKIDHSVLQFSEAEFIEVDQETSCSEKYSSVRVKIEDEFKSPESVKNSKRRKKISCDDEEDNDERSSTAARLRMDDAVE